MYKGSKQISSAVIMEKKRNILLNMIMRQTNYTEKKALNELKKWNYNTLHVMKAYLNPEFQQKKQPNNKSVNQRMMTEIRLFCDKGTKIYNMKQELKIQNALRELSKSSTTSDNNETINTVINI